MFIIGIMLSVISWFENVDFKNFAEAALTIVSVAMAVYIATTSAILGSKYSQELALKTDCEMKNKTLLGVLSSYLKNAGNSSMLTIIMSSFILLFPKEVYGEYDWWYRLFSALSCGAFSLNIVMLFCVFEFLVNSLNKAAIYNNIEKTKKISK